ncbi:MAG: CsgG/HfaB family protein [Proteobacteria bacterium]|nr:CsgG/HfaB family protein [Pseudomonadota bacterium]
MRFGGISSMILNCRNIKLLLLVILFCLCIAPAIASASPQKDIAVLPFKNVSGNSGCKIEYAVTEMLITELAKNKSFRIVERQRLEDVLKESKFQMSGLSDSNNAIKFGRLTGAKYLIAGNITLCSSEESQSSFIVDFGKKKASVELVVRIIDLETGIATGGAEGKGSSDRSSTSFAPSSVGLPNIFDSSKSVGTGTTKAEKDDLLIEAASKAVIELNEKIKAVFPLEGYIIKKDGQIVIIDIGKGMINTGSRFEVFQVGEELIHPVTKKKIGQEKNKVGEITIDKIHDEFSYGKITSSTKEIAVGNTIVLLKD